MKPYVQAAGSGIFRFGHISWEAHGNAVSFTIETAFRKSVSKEEFRDAKIGDHLILFGKEPPQFLYGDSQFASTLTMEVTAVSNTEDWVMGVTHLTHTYSTPNNQERPWMAQLVGCCRISELANNADLGFEITAEVDLTAARSSPRAATLPVITVPLAGKSSTGAVAGALPIAPSAYIPSRSGANVQWGVSTPVDVGTAAALKSSSHAYLQLPLGPLQSGQTCAQSSVGSECLVQMLSGDSSVGGGGAAMTVEGWVRIGSPQGGYILSTDHLSGTGKRVSTLSLVANETHIIVGHEREEQGSSVEIIHEMYPTNGVNLTDLWAHVALVRTHESSPATSVATQCSSIKSGTSSRSVCSRTDTACECPLCGASAGKDTMAYRVYLDGQELFQQGVDPADIEVTCGPRCNGVTCTSSAGGSLNFGAYWGPNATMSGGAVYLEGWLDEWRFWNGARQQLKIEANRKVRMNTAREAYSGDPTEGSILPDNYLNFAVILATYSMDYTCPVGVAQPCDIVSMLPVYPKGQSSSSIYTLEARGTVVTAPPDSQGVMIWQTALNEHIGVDARGRVTFDPSKGPGNYQVTMTLANADGTAKVPLDFIVRVLDTASYSESSHAYPLCSGHYEPCHYAQNAFVPTLQILGSVVPNGFCSGNLSRVTPKTPIGDLTFLAFPCSINTWSGVEMKLEARGHDQATGSVTQVGFVVGPKPAGMDMKLVRSDEFGRMKIAWTPCDAHIGSHVVCLSANDAQNDWQDATMSAASEQTCVKVQVLADPAPNFDVSVGMTRVEVVHAIMGRESKFELYAADDNCLDHIEISIDELPAGAMLEKKPAHKMECTYAHSTLRWTPAFNFGGWDGTMCFNVTDTAKSCGQQAHSVQHCVRVYVERCVYAIQQDQQLQEVAAFYEASWMQLWSLNQGLRHPDIMMYDNQVIAVRHKYRAGPHDTAGAVAKRMGMPLQQMVLLNYDLRDRLASAEDVPLQANQQLCLIPNSCLGLASTHFSQIKFKDEGSLAEYASDAIPIAASSIPA